MVFHQLDSHTESLLLQPHRARAGRGVAATAEFLPSCLMVSPLAHTPT